MAKMMMMMFIKISLNATVEDTRMFLHFIQFRRLKNLCLRRRILEFSSGLIVGKKALVHADV